jgi:hypothetical protein
VRLDDKAYAELVDVRVREPSRIAAALAGRRRRPTLAPDGVLFGAIEAAGALVQRAADDKR